MLCGALAVAVVAVVLWALGVNSDLNDQKDATAAAQQEAAQANSQVDKLSSEVDQLSQQVNAALDQTGQAGAAAKQNLQSAIADIKSRLGSLGEETKKAAEGAAPPQATPTAAAGSPAATGTPVDNAP